MQIKAIVMVSFLVAAAATLSSGNAHAYTDAEVLDQIDDAFSYDDNPRMSRGAFGLAHRMSGYDNDRFARILGEYAMGHLAIENGTRSRWAVDSIAKYGTTNSLPFLYSCATNPVCGDCAIKSIIAIEGVTSNSTSLVESYLASDLVMSQKNSIPADLCAYFVKKAVEGTQDPVLTTNAIGIVHAFAMTRNQGHTWLDRNLVSADQSYRFSKRRLAVMRAVSVKTLNDFQANYVTNAINELVAYPEADLPD